MVSQVSHCHSPSRARWPDAARSRPCFVLTGAAAVLRTDSIRQAVATIGGLPRPPLCHGNPSPRLRIRSRSRQASHERRRDFLPQVSQSLRLRRARRIRLILSAGVMRHSIPSSFNNANRKIFFKFAWFYRGISARPIFPLFSCCNSPMRG